MSSDDPFERAFTVAKKVADKRRANEANKRGEKEKMEVAERRKERMIEVQADKVTAWLRGNDGRKIEKILFQLYPESEISLGKIRLSTYRITIDGQDGYGFDNYTNVDFREELMEAFLYFELTHYPGFRLCVKVNLPNERHPGRNVISCWCRDSIERFPKKEPFERFVEIIMAWIKKI